MIHFLMSWRWKSIHFTQIKHLKPPKLSREREGLWRQLFTLGARSVYRPSTPCMKVAGDEGWEGVMATDTNVPTLPLRDWAPYIQPSNPLLHKTTTATQAGLLPVARQQAPEPHRRVSLGRGCTWKCSNGSVRTKENRQTGQTEKKRNIKPCPWDCVGLHSA